MTEPTPERVRITAPRTTRPRRTTVASEIDAQSEVGEIFMRSLMRVQLRLALTTVALLVVTVAAWPALFAIFPGLRTAHVLGIPLPWLVLGFAVYPVLIALGWSHARRAEHHEQTFGELLDRR